MVRHIRVHESSKLGFWDAVGLGMGFIMGSGIYIVPVLMVKLASWGAVLAMAVAGSLAFVWGLCFAECAIRLPKVGGLYAFAHHALGRFWGFITGYTFWTGYALTIAIETLALAWYLEFFLAWDLPARILVAASVCFALTYVNYRGVKISGWLEDGLTIGKLLPLLAILGAGIVLYRPEALASAGAFEVSGFLGALMLAFWAYQGSEVITVPEEEIQNARKTVPRAILVSVLAVMVVYVGLAVTVYLLDGGRFADSQAPLAAVATWAGGPMLGYVLAIGGLLSILGALNAVILATARIGLAMSKDGLFPKVFRRVHPRFKTPHYGLWVHWATAVVVAFAVQDVAALALVAVFFTLIPYFFSMTATLKLIRSTPHQHSLLSNHPGLPVVAAVFSLVLALFLGSTLTIWPWALLGAGVVAYGVWLRPEKKRRTKKIGKKK